MKDNKSVLISKDSYSYLQTRKLTFIVKKGEYYIVAYHSDQGYKALKQCLNNSTFTTDIVLAFRVI
jgi:hypothetical protein